MKEELLIRSFDRELCSFLKEYRVKDGTQYGYCDIRIPSKGLAFDFLKKKVEENDKLPVSQRTRLIGAWKLLRKYDKEELSLADLLQILPDKEISTCGEEHGTKYDYSNCCPICNSGRKLIGRYSISQKSIPKSVNIFQTYGGELLADDFLKDSCTRYGIKGINFIDTTAHGCYLISSSNSLKISKKTEFGCTPFDKSEFSDELSFRMGNHLYKMGKEVYKCPNGDNMGLNILSEAIVENDSIIHSVDFFQSVQNVGVHRNMVYQMPLYFCSQKFRRMVETEKLKGFKFEVAHIVEQ